MVHFVLETLAIFVILSLLVWQIVFNFLVLRPLWISMYTSQPISRLWTTGQIYANVGRSLIWPWYVVRRQRILDEPGLIP